jgi:hypothetical protein
MPKIARCIKEIAKKKFIANEWLVAAACIDDHRIPSNKLTFDEITMEYADDS